MLAHSQGHFITFSDGAQTRTMLARPNTSRPTLYQRPNLQRKPRKAAVAEDYGLMSHSFALTHSVCHTHTHTRKEGLKPLKTSTANYGQLGPSSAPVWMLISLCSGAGSGHSSYVTLVWKCTSALSEHTRCIQEHEWVQVTGALLTALKTNAEACLLGVKMIFQDRLKTGIGAGKALPNFCDGTGCRDKIFLFVGGG